MLLTVAEFRSRVAGALDTFVTDLAEVVGRAVSNDERSAWRSSLPKFAVALSSPALQSTHLYFSGPGQLSLEYQLPAANNWCDAVLLGRGEKGPCALVFEILRFVLKDGFEFCEWEVRESQAADAEAKRRAAVPDGEAQRRPRQLIDSAHARRLEVAL